MLTNPKSHWCRKQISHRYKQHPPLLHFWQGGSIPILQNSVVAAPRETTCITRTTHSLSFSRHTSSTSTLMSSILLQSLAGPTTKQRGPLRSEPSSFYHIRRPLWGDDLKRIPVPSRQVPTRNRLHGNVGVHLPSFKSGFWEACISSIRPHRTVQRGLVGTHDPTVVCWSGRYIFARQRLHAGISRVG